MKEYYINYKGNIYSNIMHYFLGTKYPEKDIIIYNGELPLKIEPILRFTKSENEIILEMGNIEFSLEEDVAVFKEVFDNSKTITFNIATLRSTGEKLEESLVLETTKFTGIIRVEILKFLSEIVNANENVAKFVKNLPSAFHVKKITKNEDLTFLTNFYNTIIFNLPELEKIINSNNLAFLQNNLGKKNFEISEANKLHQVVGLPKFAVQAIKELKMEEYTEYFKTLSSNLDGNSLNILFEFLEKGKLLFDSEFSGELRHLKKDKMILFLNSLNKICKRKTYKITDLLNYFLRQSFYFNSKGVLVFPCNEAMYLSDYLDMCEKYDLKAEKYPSQLKKVHDIVAKNIIALEADSEFYKDAFKVAVDSYRHVEKDVLVSFRNDKGQIERKEFSFIVPNTIKDIIEEGNVLHHCVGSYSNKIINKEARVVFMRDSLDKNTPLVTIDIDEEYNLVEAKKAFNEDVDDVQKRAINAWISEIQRIY